MPTPQGRANPFQGLAAPGREMSKPRPDCCPHRVRRRLPPAPQGPHKVRRPAGPSGSLTAGYVHVGEPLRCSEPQCPPRPGVVRTRRGSLTDHGERDSGYRWPGVICQGLLSS